jgi:hypothetical protein
MSKQNALKIELQNAKTLDQMFKVLTKYYDCEKELGTLAHTTLLFQLPKLITLTNTQLK